jgi:hypothetical protein
MMIKTTKKMLINIAGLKVEFQYWIVKLAAVISKGLEAARLDCTTESFLEDVVGIQSKHPTNSICPSQRDSLGLDSSYQRPDQREKKGGCIGVSLLTTKDQGVVHCIRSNHH